MSPTPSALQVHGALILAQVLFGGGAVVGKLGVEAFNPLVFALVREGVAGPLLLLVAFAREGLILPRRGDVSLFLILGLCIFGNQALFIIGDKLSGPILASAWQPSQPVFTLVISLALRWEKFTLGKVLGICASFAGGAFMVLYGQTLGSVGAIGNAMFAFNCLGTSLYVIFGKVALSRYPSLTVVSWAYICASAFTLLAAAPLSLSCWVIHFLCPVRDSLPKFQCGSYEASCQPWHVPHSAVGPLLYWILGNSMLAYFLMTWANQYARAGFILAYTALQPLTSTLVSVVIVTLFGSRGTDLALPGWNALGSVGILLGLVLLVQEGKRQHQEDSLTPNLLSVADSDSFISGSASRDILRMRTST